ncbi:MAG TPA: SRPBCC domain-containing protein [Polyangia bacterium]|nr:SRPBCC domain-containing protein [Polyangia bacterium]
MTKRRITLERTFAAPIEDVWELWTTKEGIESWWGPDGFSVKVSKLELWPGGQLLYAMTANGPDQVEFMKKAGMPLTTETRGTYEEIVKHRRLAFRQLADFVPGVAPYDVATLVELHPTAQGVRMELTFDAMHDEQWTKLAEMGWRNELDKMERALAAHRQAETK